MRGCCSIAGFSGGAHADRPLCARVFDSDARAQAVSQEVRRGLRRHSGVHVAQQHRGRRRRRGAASREQQKRVKQEAPLCVEEAAVKQPACARREHRAIVAANSHTEGGITRRQTRRTRRPTGGGAHPAPAGACRSWQGPARKEHAGTRRACLCATGSGTTSSAGCSRTRVRRVPPRRGACLKELCRRVAHDADDAPVS